MWRTPHVGGYSSNDIKDITLFAKRNYKAAYNYDLNVSHEHDINCLFETTARRSPMRKEFINHTYILWIVLYNILRLKSVTSHERKSLK